MDFALFVFDNLHTLVFPSQILGYLLEGVYLLLVGRFFFVYRQEWRNWPLARWAGLVAALGLGFVASGLFLVFLPGPEILPLPNLTEIPDLPGVPLLGVLLIFVAGIGMGVGPAILVGGAAGLGHALGLSGRGTQVVEFALLAAAVAFLLRQEYQGVGFAWLRRPIWAGVVGGLMASLVTFPFLLTGAGPETPILSAVDYAWSHTRAAILPNLLEWGLAGLLVESVFVLSPALLPRPVRLVPPPYEYSLTRRFLYVLLPFFLVTMIVLLVAVTDIATDSATDLTLKQMSHDARVASEAIPDLDLISTNLLTQIAHDENLLLGSQGERQAIMDQFFTLERWLLTSAYFRQLVVFDRSGLVVQQYPEDSTPLLDSEESIALRAATEGYPDETRVWAGGYGVPILSHVVPIWNEQGAPIGALLGRVDMQVALASTVSSLQGTVGAGRGFIVDGQGYTIAHSNKDRLMQPWSPPEDPIQELNGKLPTDDLGQAYEGIGFDGTRQLVYYRDGPDHPWIVVVIVPYERVLSLATEVAGPLALFLVGGGALLAVVLALLIRRLNQPLLALSRAAGAMAHRDLETPILVSGEDEVGRLGDAFEQMRRVLRDRLSELQLLLGVSQGVAANLDLSQGLPLILDGALEATGADGVRIVAVSDKERGSSTFSKGSLGAAMAPLDLTIARLVQRDSGLRLDNTGRTRIIPGLDQLADQVGAILALPLSTSQGYQGVLWIAYREPHAFTKSEVGFISTLAGQASVLIENVQLFEAAEGGRQRLAAILASTGDAVIVIDQEDRILLLNPAAEADFEMAASQVMGQPVASVLSDAGLIDLLTVESGQGITREVELPDGRVLYASASSISGDVGQMGGRVAVLRDITHLKELDEMKTDFVNTVSHDLRSPLTYMRGYVTMLPMIGELSIKQKEYLAKILSGIDQMTRLVGDLLSLARIESDVDQLVQPIEMGGLIQGVAKSYNTHAVSKGLSFNVQVADGLLPVEGNPTLLRQAVANLIDNAIKYTPNGEVNVRAHMGENHVVIQVQDTGPGISQADQVRLFERFFRVKRRDSLGIKGTGLGLAIVKSIVERRSGGRVWVESKLGAGSSFFIVLPIKFTPKRRS